MLKFIENNAIYDAMNVIFWSRHKNTSLESAKIMLAESYKKGLALADKYFNEELLKKYFS